MLKIFRRAPGANDPFNGVKTGDRVRCTLTGFTGIVTGRIEYLTGCNQVFVLPRADKDNEYKEGMWFDIERIEKLEDSVVAIEHSPGGADLPRPPGEGRRL